METRSKRRRLLHSHVSPPRPDLSACFESLSDDPLTTVLEFVGGKSYRSFGGVNKHCKEVYLNTKGMTKETFVYGYAPLSAIKDRIERSNIEYRALEMEFGNLASFYDWEVFHGVGIGVICYNRRDVMDWALGEKDKQVLRGVCYVAAREERLDILVEVLDNVEDDEDNKKFIFESVDYSAALYGKLNILKWLETKGLSINKESCAKKAAEEGHICILRWLRDEKGLELDGGCYDSACRRGQLHVLKWLREKQVPWDDDTFRNAAFEDNLEILQWLHNEGCPWPEDDDYVLHEIEVTFEVIEWLHMNGYGDRIVEIE